MSSPGPPSAAAALLGGALVLALLSACSDGAARSTPSPTSPRSLTISVPLQPGDVAQHAPARRNGHLLLAPILARCGIAAITGTHAEFLPKRPLCRIRVRVVSDDASFHSFSANAQLLVLADGRTVEQSPDARNIKRQPDTVEIGARNTLELDLWYEPPTGAKVRGLRLVGDHDPDPPGASVATASGPPEGFEVPLSGI